MIFKSLLNNWHIKLFALLVALGMWAYAASSETSVAKFPSAIPIKQINLTPGYVAVYDQKEVKIEIAAEPGTWNKLSAESFTSYIDLNGLSVGTHDIPVNVTTLITGVQIISKTPSTMVVTIEPSSEKNVPIVAKVSGNAAENMISGDITFSPNSVKISGPKSVVDGISQITAEIVLSGEGDNFSKSVKLVALDNKNEPIQFVSISPATVNADVKIVRAGNVKNIGIKVITNGSPASGYFVSSISTNPSVVSVLGAPDTIRTITSVSTQPMDIANITKNITANVKLVVPNGVRIDGDVTSISVTISLSSQPSLRTITIPVKTKNIPSGLRLSSISPQTVDVVISGLPDAVNNLATENASLVVDLSSAASGSNQISISNGNFSLPTGVSVASFSPSIIQIILQ
jgi:YbbR domain-containing protein